MSDRSRENLSKYERKCAVQAEKKERAPRNGMISLIRSGLKYIKTDPQVLLCKIRAFFKKTKKKYFNL